MNSSRSEAESSRRISLPAGYLVARFIRFYGRDMFWAADWPTRDGVIPFRLYYAMLGAIHNLESLEQLQAYTPALLAGASVHGSAESRGTRQRFLQDLSTAAYPEQHRRPTTTPPTEVSADG